MPESATLLDNFTQAVTKYPTNKCLGWREKQADGTVGPYIWKTYKEVGEEVKDLASGLSSIGAVTKGSIGVFGPNCPQWMMAMQVKGWPPKVKIQIRLQLVPHATPMHPTTGPQPH